MKLTRSLITATAAIAAATAAAQVPTVEMTGVSLVAGGSGQTAVEIKAGEGFLCQGLQFELTPLPGGVEIDYGATEAALGGYTVTGVTRPDGTSLLLAYGPEGVPARGGDRIMTITFTAGEQTAPGTYTIETKGVVFSSPLGGDIAGAGGTLTITVGEGPTPPPEGPGAPEKPEIPSGPVPDGMHAGADGTYVSALKIREGNTLSMGVNAPVGGYPDGWEYLWTDPAGREIGESREIETTALLYGEAASAGNRQAISDNTYLLEASDYVVTDADNGAGDLEEGDLFWSVTLQTPRVSVYKRPQAPSQLLRKGQHPQGGQTPETGKSQTLVVMMTPLSDTELSGLGYSYTYGYTETSGAMRELGTTSLRYWHVPGELYWSSDVRFWAYTSWSYPDGSVVSSGLRYLDGGEDPGFDASDFDGTRASGITGLPLREEGSGIAEGVYTLDGRYAGRDTEGLGRGVYIIRTNSTSKKVIL